MQLKDNKQDDSHHRDDDAISRTLSLGRAGLRQLIAGLAHRERRSEAARFALSRLRAEGVALRNEATSNLEGAFREDWKLRATCWSLRTVHALQKIDESEAERFSLVDPEAETRLRNEDEFAIHDSRLKRLGELIHELWSE